MKLKKCIFVKNLYLIPIFVSFLMIVPPVYGQEIEEIIVRGTILDNSVIVEVSTSKPNEGENVPIKIEFKDKNYNNFSIVKYDVIVEQEGNTVLSEHRNIAKNGQEEWNTKVPFSTNEPFDIKITIREIDGKIIPEFEREVLMLRVVTEFEEFLILFLIIFLGIFLIFTKIPTLRKYPIYQNE